MSGVKEGWRLCSSEPTSCWRYVPPSSWPGRTNPRIFTKERVSTFSCLVCIMKSRQNHKMERQKYLQHDSSVCTPNIGQTRMLYLSS